MDWSPIFKNPGIILSMLPERDRVIIENLSTCPNCGTLTDADEKCPECGAELEKFFKYCENEAWE